MFVLGPYIINDYILANLNLQKIMWYCLNLEATGIPQAAVTKKTRKRGKSGIGLKFSSPIWSTYQRWCLYLKNMVSQIRVGIFATACICSSLKFVVVCKRLNLNVEPGLIPKRNRLILHLLFCFVLFCFVLFCLFFLCFVLFCFCLIFCLFCFVFTRKKIPN